MKIKKIVSLSDIHIRKVSTRNEEYLQVFERLYESLREKNPDRIVIVGDLVDNYLDLSPSQIIIANNFLNELSKIAEVRITRGNHDLLITNINATDSIEAIVKTLNNPKIVYYNKTGFYYDDDSIVWAVWNHGEKNNNPWKSKEAKKLNFDGHTTIDLFHDPINGCISENKFEMNKNCYYKLSDFKGNYLMAGDIHLQQFLNKEKTKGYSSSLIAQKFSEGDNDFHGYLLWDIENKFVEKIPIYNKFSYKNIIVDQFLDFDNIDITIPNVTEYMRVRFLWRTLPQIRNVENERKLTTFIKNKYGDQIISIFNKNEFIQSDKIDINQSLTLQNVNDKAVQHDIFKEYYLKIGTEQNVINDILLLDDEISNEIQLDENTNIQWDIIKFGGINFMSYEKFDIDWRDKTGLIQISGKNQYGKSTIFKNLSYVLFNKSNETETRKKFGDSRYVNNRNNATFCESYVVIEANNEYYGIKRRTDIQKSKTGEINSTPTILSYYLLSTPDDEMNDDNSLNRLEEDRKFKTQKKINTIIGSYENFNKVFTTSDTLNQSFSENKSSFLDLLLLESGLDIFDKKLEVLKLYQQRLNKKSRITCNLDLVINENKLLIGEIKTINEEINIIESINIPEITNRIEIGKTYVEDLTKKLFKIDSEIYSLNINIVKNDILIHTKKINEYESHKAVLLTTINTLKETYDENRYNELITKKDEHKIKEYQHKLDIKNIEQSIREEEHKIEIINGDIFRLKQEGTKCKSDISELRESKICPTCSQPLLPEHQIHIDEKIKSIETKMFDIAKQIKTKDEIDKLQHINIINEKKNKIIVVKETIEKDGLTMELILKELGTILNDKNDVEKREKIISELNQLPIQIQNEQLKIDILKQKLHNYENSLKQIEENKKTEENIKLAKSKLISIVNEEKLLRENVFNKKIYLNDKQNKIKTNNDLIEEFKKQEYQDMIINLYKKTIHRDGIPTQMLKNNIIPLINQTLADILSNLSFKVWLDEEELIPKMAFNKRPKAIIDCISSSGKERTFAAISLKIAENQINCKSKPMFFMLDEVTGKLDQDSIEEFIEMLDAIKKKMKRIIIVEHNHQLNPDHIIEVNLNENDISYIQIK